MKIEVARPIEMKVAGKKEVLKPGVHEIEDADAAGWYFQGLVSSGAIKVVDEVQRKPVKLNYNIPRIILGENSIKETEEEVAENPPPEEIKRKLRVNRK